MTIREIRINANMTQQEFADYFKIPKRTIENWEGGKRNPPEYVIELIRYKAKKERLGMLKLAMINHGEEEILKEGTLQELTEWLKDNYRIFDFIWEGVAEENGDINITTPYENLENEVKEIFIDKMPQLDEIYSIADLEYELEKVNLDWWVLRIREYKDEKKKIKEKYEIRYDELARENEYKYFIVGSPTNLRIVRDIKGDSFKEIWERLLDADEINLEKYYQENEVFDEETEEYIINEPLDYEVAIDEYIKSSNNFYYKKYNW